jgi:hypothetical protein
MADVTAILDQAIGGALRGTLTMLMGHGATADAAVAVAIYASGIPLKVMGEILDTTDCHPSPQVADAFDQALHHWDVVAMDIGAAVQRATES